MDYRILKNVLEINKRPSVYIPEHKKWVELSKVLTEENGVYSYEILRLDWDYKFNIKNYCEDNFDKLFVKPSKVEYPEPEMNEEMI